MEFRVVLEEELFFGWRDVVDEGGAANADYGAAARVSRCGRGRGEGGGTYDVNILKYMRQFVGRGGMLSCGYGGIGEIVVWFL